MHFLIYPGNSFSGRGCSAGRIGGGEAFWWIIEGWYIWHSYLKSSLWGKAMWAGGFPAFLKTQVKQIKIGSKHLNYSHLCILETCFLQANTKSPSPTVLLQGLLEPQPSYSWLCKTNSSAYAKCYLRYCPLWVEITIVSSGNCTANYTHLKLPGSPDRCNKSGINC